MKLTLFRMSSLLLVVSLALTGCQKSTADSQGNAMNGSTPCQNIKTACEKAGFTLRGPQGKRLIMDCVSPLLAGKQVSGVNASQSDIQNCKQKRSAVTQQQ